VAQAIARYVVRCEDARKGIIIGYDHRFASDSIAANAAEVVSASGTPVFLTDNPVPRRSFLLVRQRGAAGLMITASHNPYQWNGIKYKASYGSSALPSIVAQMKKISMSCRKKACRRCRRGKTSFSLWNARAVSRHTRKTGRLATAEEGEVPLRLRCHAWLGHGLARRTFPAQCIAAMKFAARTIRASAAYIRNRSSRISRLAASSARRKIRRRLVRRWRWRPHRRHRP